MKIISTNPSGEVTVLDLAQVAAVRLQLVGISEYFGVGLKYSVGAASASRTDGIWYGTEAVATMMLAAIFMPSVEASSFEPIVHVGFPMGDRDKDLDRLKDAWKTLYNERPAGVVDEAMEKLGGIVDFFYWLRPFFLGSAVPGNGVGPEQSGTGQVGSSTRTLDKWSVTVRG